MLTIDDVMSDHEWADLDRFEKKRQRRDFSITSNIDRFKAKKMFPHSFKTLQARLGLRVPHSHDHVLHLLLFTFSRSFFDQKFFKVWWTRPGLQLSWPGVEAWASVGWSTTLRRRSSPTTASAAAPPIGRHGRNFSSQTTFLKIF